MELVIWKLGKSWCEVLRRDVSCKLASFWPEILSYLKDGFQRFLFAVTTTVGFLDIDLVTLKLQRKVENYSRL